MNSVVFGNLGVSLTDRHGARLTRLPLRASDPRPVRLPHGPDVSAPPFLVGRDEQLALVRRAVRERSAVEFTGPCGAGKSTLLRNAAAAGGVYVRVGGTELEDLLQDLMRQFYVYSSGVGGVRLTTEQCAWTLGQVTGVVVLDDVSYSPEQLGYLRRVLPGCALVIGAPVPVLGVLGNSRTLPGLPEAAAVALLSHELGRFIPDSEMAAVRRLVAAVDGQPLRLRQAGALARVDGRSFAELAARAESDPGILDELSISATGPQAKRALAVLTLVGGALLPGALLSQMADIAYVSETLESLTARGLAEQAADRFGLPVCKSEPYRRILYRYIGLASVLRALGAWLTSGDPTGEETRGAAEAALSLLGVAAEQREWQVVVRLTTVVERVLFVQGHWQAWQNTLAQGITAAQAAGDKAAEAYFTHQQGVQHFLHDRTDHARRLLRRALDLRTQLGDVAGAAVTRANLALLEPPPPPPMPPSAPAASRTANSRRLVLAAVAGVVAVLVIGSAIVQAVGGGGGTGGGGGSDPPPIVSAGPGGTDISGGTTTGQTTTGETTTGQTTTGQTTAGNGGTPPITLSAPAITPSAQSFGTVNISPLHDTRVLDFTITNPNGQAVALDSVGIPGDTGFSTVRRGEGGCSDRLEAGASCTVSVRYAPNRLGPASTGLTVASGESTSTAELTGTGVVHITVAVDGPAEGNVTINGVPPEVTCDGLARTWGCDFDVATEGLSLTATISGENLFFDEWSGVCVNPDVETSCAPALDENGTVTVEFASSRIG
ncbi:hypothetical protein [Streptomyces sp. Agncl-13]|uniref:hypothetical protein n=1 Tax=Streptomyces sp. Agncl-13 TaxID=3400628 RepID=UPI003A845B4E